MIKSKRIKQSTITFYTRSDTEVNGAITSTGWTENLTVNGFAYLGSISKSYTDDRFKSDVKATLIIDYNDFTGQVNEDDKVIVTNFGTFSVMFVDNVANQNRIIQIPCKEYTPNVL